MTIDELYEAAPAAFALTPDPNVSSRYVYIPTMPIVERLLDAGWQIRSARQRADDQHAMHRIDFDLGGDHAWHLGEVRPTASLYNSHNRSRRMGFDVGLFVCICSNQARMPMLSRSIERIHLADGPDVNALVDGVFESHESLAHQVNAMQQRTLDDNERLGYAKRAEMHYGGHASTLFVNEHHARAALVDRHSRNRTDLWTTFNIVQENIIERGRTGRGVHEILRNHNLNLALWNEATALLN